MLVELLHYSYYIITNLIKRKEKNQILRNLTAKTFKNLKLNH